MTGSLPPVVLLDLDDTILDDSGSVSSCWERACAAHLAAAGDADVQFSAVRDAIARASKWFWSDPERHRTGRLDLDAARRHVVSLAFSDLKIDRPDLADAIGTSYSEERDRMMCALPGAIETLAWLRERGHRLALITNGAAAAQRRKIERFDLARWFEHVFVEGEMGIGKPSEQVYRTALERMSVAPADACMIGDNLEWDVVAPKRMGLGAIWIDAGQKRLPAEGAHEPDRIVQRLSDLRVD